MAVIKPFKALRPDPRVVHLVASVPYDVVNREEASALAEDNPLSFLRVSRAEIELHKKTDPYSPEVYQKAKENFEKLKTDAPLIQDEKPLYYVYRLIMGGQSQVGIAATFSVNDYDNDVIKKHEKTRKAKEDDRTNHILSVEAQTGPVFLTYKGIEEINNTVDKTMEDEPEYDFTSPDGVRHTLWIMSEDFNDIIAFELEKVEHLYIADGHHRAASAARAQKVKRENNVDQTGEEEYNFFLAVLFPAEQLKILPYNRVVYNLAGNTESEFMEKVKENFTLEVTDNPNPPERGTICMYIGGKWYLMRPTEKVKSGETVAESLDVSILQNYLLSPILGIEDPRTDTNIDFIGGIRGTGELERLVNGKAAKAAFSMFPVTVEDLMAISDAGETMPPKSTWFEPKLRDAMVIHLI